MTANTSEASLLEADEKPIVYTYFEPDNSMRGFDYVLSEWERRWTAVGYNPIVLTESNARRHPSFNAFDEHVSSMPTINPKSYERSCWLRWLAMEVVGGGLATDSDVLPTADFELSKEFKKINKLAGTTVLEEWGVPCAVWVDPADPISQEIMNYHEVGESMGKPHASDMFYFFAAGRKGDVSLCADLRKENWKVYPTVHLATCSLREMGFNGKVDYALALSSLSKYLAS